MLCRGDTRSLDYVWGCVQSDLMSVFFETLVESMGLH